MDSYLTGVRHVTVSRNVIRTTLEVIREFGTHGCEALILWLGKVEPPKAYVTRAYVPEQEPIKSEDGVGYFVTSETLFQLNRALSETGLRFIAQVHSHPGEAYHSETDDRYAIMTMEGGFSLVVPDFGRRADDPAFWAMYRLDGGEWRPINLAQGRDLVQVEKT